MYKYKSMDSTNLLLVQTIKYDKNEHEIELLWKDFPNQGDAKIANIFNKSGRIIEKYHLNMAKYGEDKLTKTFYEYYANDKLKKSIEFDYKKRIRKDVDRGDGRYYPKDFEKYKSWELGKVWNYEYDEKNRLIKEYTNIVAHSQQIYTYKYDSKDRVIELCKSSDQGMYLTEKYRYFKDSSENIVIWYDYKGNIDTSETIKKYWDTIRKEKYDPNGNTTEKNVFERKDGSLRNQDKMWYDNKNRLIRQEVYEKSELKETYIYHYNDIKELKENIFLIKKE